MDKRKLNKPPKNGKQFTSEYRPDPKNISKAKQKASLLRRLANNNIGGQSKIIIDRILNHLGIKDENITIELAMHIKQIELAIKEGDTKAYNSVMDRILGKSQQNIEINDITTQPLLPDLTNKQNTEEE